VNAHALGYVREKCASDVGRAYCVRLHLGIVVRNRVETLHATNAAEVATNVLVTSVCVVYEFARARVRSDVCVLDGLCGI
jgi:hypothetical protein